MTETLLFVCTANLCRSPMAEALFMTSHAGSGVQARSAGIVPSVQPPPNHVLETIARRGGDLTGHLPRGINEALLEDPGLILTMTRQHLRSIAELDSNLLSKTFTLKEFVRRSELAGKRQEIESLSGYAYRVGLGRNLATLISGNEDDIADPMGGRRSSYTKCARELESLILRLVPLIRESEVGSSTT